MPILPENISLKKETVQFLAEPVKMLIDGEWVSASSGNTISTINPANGEVLTKVPLADKNDVDDAVRSARAAFNGKWTTSISPAKRGELMWRFADLLEENREHIAELETLDNGKPISEARLDVDASVNHFRYYAGWTTKIEGATIPVSVPNQLVYTKREPLGVIGLITPWNFPLSMAAWKLAPALACGNTVVIKPAIQTSLTTLKLGALFMEAGFPPGVVNVISGKGSLAGDVLTHHMDVDKIGFTGSTAVGKKIMEAAAKSNLKKVSLELGGKSPNVIFADADLNHVMDELHWCSFYNSGQECTSGSRLYVEESIIDKVVSGLKENAGNLTIGNGLTEVDLGPMISQQQMDTVLDYIESGKTEGAEVIAGGKRLGGDLSDGYFLSPTIFLHQKDDLKVVKEEIFGPVVTVSPFKNFDEITERSNDTPYGLAAAVWTNDIKKAHRFAHAVKAGTVWVNSYDQFDPAVPFGGYKQSGFGREMGKSAIELYTQEKAVWVAL
jgi:acyl-CoA reductase-like NAD-dependent aldehyde dehydrogenase